MIGALLNLGPLWRLGAAIALALALVLGGYAQGHADASQAAQLREAKAQQAAAEQLRAGLAAAVKQGAKDVAQLDVQLGANTDFSLTQTQRTTYAQHLLTVPRAGPVVACVADQPATARRPGAVVAGSDAGGPAGPGLRSSVVPAAAAGAAGDGAGVRLSLAAVSLWNTSLARTDVPAGACRPDDTASPACAAESGLEIGDAWVNHEINAASCAADRLRYQRLIDHLQRRGNVSP